MAGSRPGRAHQPVIRPPLFMPSAIRRPPERRMWNFAIQAPGWKQPELPPRTLRHSPDQSLYARGLR